MSDDDEKDVALIPVSPSTKLDPEIRQFVSRVMLGYEASHRQIVEMSMLMAKRAEQAEAAAARAIELQIRLAEEREELLSKRHQRDLASEAAKHRQEAVQELTRDLRAMLPLVGKKLLGAPLTGNDSHGLQDLLNTLSIDQIESVMSSGKLELSVAQRQLLASTLSSLAENEKKPEAAE